MTDDDADTKLLEGGRRPRLRSWAGWDLVNFDHAFEWSVHELIESDEASDLQWTKDDCFLDVVLPPYEVPPLAESDAQELLKKYKVERVTSAVQQENLLASVGKKGGSDRSRLSGYEMELAVELDLSRPGARVTATKPAAQDVDSNANGAKPKSKASHRLMFKTLQQATSNSLLIRNSTFADDDEQEDDAAPFDRAMVLDVIQSYGDPQLVHFGPDMVVITFYDRRDTEAMMGLFAEDAGPNKAVFCVPGILWKGPDGGIYRQDMLSLRSQEEDSAALDQAAVLAVLGARQDAVASFTSVSDKEVHVEFYKVGDCRGALEHAVRSAATRHQLGVGLVAAPEALKRKHASLFNFVSCDHHVGFKPINSLGIAPGAGAAGHADDARSTLSRSPGPSNASQYGSAGPAGGLPTAASAASSSGLAAASSAYPSMAAAAARGVSDDRLLPRSSSGGNSSVSSHDAHPNADSNSVGSASQSFSGRAQHNGQQAVSSPQLQAQRGRAPGRGQGDGPRRADHETLSTGSGSVSGNDPNNRRMRSIAPIHRGSASRNRDNSEFQIKVGSIMSGRDNRTSVMIKNIPNKYTQKMVLEELDATGFQGTYDFFYLPIDFQAGCNLGYAFINFHEPQTIPQFFSTFNQRRWNMFNSDKICEVAYARIQGCESLLRRLEKSCVMEQDREYQPVMFNRDGTMIEDLTTTSAYSRSRSRGRGRGGRGGSSRPGGGAGARGGGNSHQQPSYNSSYYYPQAQGGGAGQYWSQPQQ